MLNGSVTQELSSLSKEGTEILKEPLVQEFIQGITEDAENSVSIIKCLLEGKLTDEEISEEIELRLNIVRRILYKLYDAGIASYKRSKDPETQWYTYSWKFDSEKVIETISEKYKQSSKEMEESLAYEEENMFFSCVNGCRYNFEEASEHNFICPECESTLEYQDNSSLIDELKGQMNS
ncbi:MAG: transcription factor E [Methanobacterium sp.]|jgi:transcription initiation factor TFIIE subunit alpha